jgi:hypothetical protein
MTSVLLRVVGKLPSHAGVSSRCYLLFASSGDQIDRIDSAAGFLEFNEYTDRMHG